MNNKYVMTRNQNVKFVKENMEDFISNSLFLSHYDESDPLTEVAYNNFKETYEFIINNPDVENDYNCLCKMHKMLMKGLNDDVKSELNEEQINQLHEMINQPAKANLEIAIDVMLFIYEKKLFADGDVRAALAFANKIMVDCGCGFITIPKQYCDTYREKLTEFKNGISNDIKDWIYKYCTKGIKNDY